MRRRLLLSAYPVLTPPSVESWSPIDVLLHLLSHTECKVIIVDSERADRFESHVPWLRSEAKTTAVLVIESQEGRGRWEGIEDWDNSLGVYSGVVDAVTEDPAVVPEDDATIYFTSGRLQRCFPGELDSINLRR
jgi:long-subunit acyl-CoA synthetase (AMP-forming)